eukprot:TRINITY_DN10641_c0_g1_i1.p1 TRINITY_DN10641_c0_g1~~TRINITY_DN10641_c0_g1_i1.p1  ORF type:complete len:123 (-),score=10.00 TRINITY_DN10641_c0_g1_i1:31-399(-)
MQPVFIAGAPEPIAPYTPAIKANGLVFVSGQIGMNEKEELATGIEEQTKCALERVRTTLKAAGSDMNKVVKATVFLTSMSDFNTVNGIYATYFTKPYPTRSCIAVKELPRGAIVEVEVVALQ